MNLSKMWIFIIGIIAGAIFLGDSGGDALRDVLSSARQGASSIMDAGGSGLSDFGESVSE